MMMMFLLYLVYVQASNNCCKERCKLQDDAYVCDSYSPQCIWKPDSNDNKNGEFILEYIIPKANLYQSQITQFCTQINKQKCSLTFGCSYYNDLCIKFLGCDAYQSYSDQDCFNISYLCDWDEEKQVCVRSPYYDQKGNIRDKRDCNSAPLKWRSNERCPKYSNQCIFNGILCAESLGYCKQYQTTTENCSKLIGIDGQCIYQNDGCTAKSCGNYKKDECTKYSSDCYLNIDQQCSQKQKCERNNVKTKQSCLNKIEQNCYFNGNSCSLIPLKFCSEYKYDQCQELIGRDGICKSSNKCVKLDCQNDLNNEYKNKGVFDDYCQILYICEQKNTNCKVQEKEQCLNIMQTSTDCICQECIVNKQDCLSANTQLECVQNYQLLSTIPCYWNYDQNQCLSATKCSQLQNKSSCLRFKPSCQFRNNNCIDMLEQDCNQIYTIENNDQILDLYCLQSLGCAIFNSKCIPLSISCDDYKSEATCFKDLLNQPCIWNSSINRCFTYKERQSLLKVECELMSSFWVYQNNKCDVKKSCTQLSLNDTGLEGNCTKFQLNQIEQNATTCSDIPIDTCSNFSHICKLENNICQNLSCSDFNSTQCKHIIGFQFKVHKYCRVFGQQCFETLPTNEQDCIFFSGGYNFFTDNYCVSCSRDDECKGKYIPYLYKELPQEIQSHQFMIMIIIFYILIIIL